MKLTYLIVFFFLSVFLASAQSEQLAKNYAEQGEYGKAIATYEALLKKFPVAENYLLGLVEAYQQLERFDDTEAQLKKAIQLRPHSGQLLVELGYNYELAGKTVLATESYTKAIETVNENPAYAFGVGRAFEKYSLLDEAVVTYTKAASLGSPGSFDVQLARIYGEQGKVEDMLSTYIDLIIRDEKYYFLAQRNFGQFITENPENKANQTFKRLLLQKSQAEPNVLYNRLLSWLFVSQGDFLKAFVQEKAIVKRNENMSSMVTLASNALDAEAYEDAVTILNYIKEESLSAALIFSVEQRLLQIAVATAEAEGFEKIHERFKNLLDQYGRTPRTFSLQLDAAHFSAFKMNRPEEAITAINTLLEQPISPFQKARAKILLGDMMVLQGRFNSALIYYTQAQKGVDNDVLAQEARFKVAKTSYYKGDFDWAKTQLKVLKSSASKLTANDAQQLFLLITDNSYGDSTQVALKQFARADLLAFQEKQDEAILAYGEILTNYKGESIEDEALLAQAKLYESRGNFAEAEQNYITIITFFKDDILADDAYYYLANLYVEKLNDPEKAKQNYEQIIFNHEDSIYYVEAQRKYRELRGDVVN
ncbi:MAG: tetratricopeptide repeat protein [Leeuwenhoekiella sp.]